MRLLNNSKIWLLFQMKIMQSHIQLKPGSELGLSGWDTRGFWSHPGISPPASLTDVLGDEWTPSTPLRTPRCRKAIKIRKAAVLSCLPELSMWCFHCNWPVSWCARRSMGPISALGWARTLRKGCDRLGEDMSAFATSEVHTALSARWLLVFSSKEKVGISAPWEEPPN